MMKLSIFRHTLLLIIICCFGFFVYHSTLSHGFSSIDDHQLINANKNVINGNHIRNILSEHLSGFKSYYRPLQTYSYRIDYLLWGLDPFGYHLSSIALHLINACLLYIFLYLLFRNIYGPFCAALLFVCHPAFSEPVNFIASRSDLLVGAFFLTTMIFYILYQGNRKKIFLVFSCCAFFFSFLSKEVSLLAPFFILFLESLYRKKYNSTSIYFILSFLFVLFRASVVGLGAHRMPNFYFFLTLPKAILLYITAFLFPFGLEKKWCLHFVTSAAAKDFLVPLFIILVFVYAVLRVRKYSRICCFGPAWFLFTLTIVSLVASQIWDQVMPFSYAWLYVPSIGLFTMLAYLGPIALTRFQNRRFVPRGLKPRLLRRGWFWPLGYFALVGSIFVGFFIIVAVFSFTTIAINKKWSEASYVSFEKNVLGELPENVSASIQATNNGYRLLEAQKTSQAAAEFRRALALLATNHKAMNNLGSIFLNQRRFDQALYYFKMSNSIRPYDPGTHYNTGLVYLMQNDTQKAVREFEKAVKLDFNHFDAHYNLLILYSRENNEEKALRELSAIKYLDPAFDIAKMDKKKN